MLIKRLLHRICPKLYTYFWKKKIEFQTFPVVASKLLRGGENGIRAAKYAELTQNFMRPSTSVMEGPHIQLLQLYDKIGDKVLEDEIFEETPYYKNAYECMKLTGSYFYDRPEKIKVIAERFINQYKRKNFDLSKQPGQSNENYPVLVRPIKHSSCYEVIDGNHRIARAIMRGDQTIPVMIYEKEATYTPLQQLLLDCLWIKKQKWLYQPIEAPELKDEWVLIRKCTDRLNKMAEFLQSNNLRFENETYLDIGSSYGWFVKAFSSMGFSAFGLERDPFGMEIGFKVLGVNPSQIIHSDLVLGLEDLVRGGKTFSVVSCLSVLHHFVLHKNSTSAEALIKLIDKITDRVLFFDTGEEHETSFNGVLKGWSPQYIEKWLKKNTSFTKIVSLGEDQDCKPPFEGYYRRTLFACIK